MQVPTQSQIDAAELARTARLSRVQHSLNYLQGHTMKYVANEAREKAKVRRMFGDPSA